MANDTIEEITVRVVRFGDRTHLQMQYVDLMTGLKKTRSTETTERVAPRFKALDART
jgi:hypothetical protein